MRPMKVWIAPLALAVASTAGAGVTESVLAALSQGSEARAVQELRAYRATKGVTPELLEAQSWLARAELGSRRYSQAAQYAQETYDLSVGLLKTRRLDQEARLPIALGAAIEVQAGVLAETARRSEAVAYLQEQKKQFGATSIAARIQ